MSKQRVITFHSPADRMNWCFAFEAGTDKGLRHNGDSGIVYGGAQSAHTMNGCMNARKLLTKSSEGRIAYIHRKNMRAAVNWQHFLEGKWSRKGRAGKTLEFWICATNNRMGNVHDEVLTFLSQATLPETGGIGAVRLQPNPNFTPGNQNNRASDLMSIPGFSGTAPK